MKRAHLLRANHETQCPREYVFVDTETYPVPEGRRERHLLRLGWAAHVRVRDGDQPATWSWHRFTDKDSFWSWLDDRTRARQKYLLYAHNMHYDWAVLDGWGELTKRGWSCPSPFFSSTTFILKWKRDRRKIWALDSGNIVKVPLRVLGDRLGLPKLDTDVHTDDLEALSTYCHRDVEILAKWVLEWRRFVRENDLGNYRPTLAAQAMSAFLHRFNQTDIYIHDRPYVYRLEREAYRGGLCLPFYIGSLPTADYTQVDVNSMYPHVMRSGLFPCKLRATGAALPPSDLPSLLRKGCMVAEVVVETERQGIPCNQGDLLYPIGTFRTVLTTPELRMAMREGKIRRVGRWSLYDSAPLFRDYVDWMYGHRFAFMESGDDVGSYLCKLLGNSLYGKWGQRSETATEIGECDSMECCLDRVIDADTGKFWTEARANGKIWRIDRQPESANSFPAIAAHVTAMARLHLWKLIREAGDKHAFYCDTDSVLVDETGLAALEHHMDERRLGALKVEATADHGIIHGPKDYIFGDKRRLKGVRPNAWEVAPGVFAQERWYKSKGLMRHRSADAPIVEPIMKRLARTYSRGTVDANGWVSPLRLSLSDSSRARR